MLFDGAAVQGDESVLVHRSGASLAVPRAFHVKDGTAAMVPELLAVPGWHDLPQVHDITVLDPTLVRAPWTLVEAPVDHVVLLDHDPATPTGEEAAIEPIPNAVVLEALVAQTFPLTESTAELLRTLIGAVGRARGHRLRGPDPRATFDALLGVLS